MRRSFVAALLGAAFIVAGCGNTAPRTSRPPQPTTHCTPGNASLGCNLPPVGFGLPQSSAPVVAHGIDFAWSSPSAGWMRANGFSFGASYLSYDASKNWSSALVSSYTRAGIARVFVWETSANRALEGCGAGQSDARTALSEGARFGFRALYFAVDFELQPNAYGAVASYFRCVDGVIGVDHTGAYGGISTVRLLFNLHLIAYGWQTYAWSGGRWDPRAQLQQYLNGSSFDYDRAVARDYGQTPFSSPKPKPPAPKPKPPKAALIRQRAQLRVLLTRHRCRVAPYHGRGVYHRVCSIWLREGQQVNREINA
jgi:hypothetical protein